MNLEGGWVCIEKSIPRGRGGGVCIEKSIRGGGVELSGQLLDPDVPTLASQDKLKVSPKGLPFVMRQPEPEAQHHLLALSNANFRNHMCAFPFLSKQWMGRCGQGCFNARAMYLRKVRSLGRPVPGVAWHLFWRLPESLRNLVACPHHTTLAPIHDQIICCHPRLSRSSSEGANTARHISFCVSKFHLGSNP